MLIEQISIETLIPYANNARTHSEAQVAQIAASIREFGFNNPVLIDEQSSIIAGHGRVLAARKLELDSVPCIRLNHLSETQRRAYIIADNKIAMNAGWDEELLALELTELTEFGVNMDLTGFTQEEIKAFDPDGGAEGGGDMQKGSLSAKFLIAPFSVLNAREGWWQDRKRAWLAIGIKSELGRGGTASTSARVGDNDEATYRTIGGKRRNMLKYAVCLETGIGEKYGREEVTGTSIFDPVLCEIAYRWFSPVGGMILDPFSGGSVRGIVASKLERQYIGQDLREEQVAANRIQADNLCGNEEYPPVWIVGDSRNIDKTCGDVEADMIFSCPPYADLEVYSDDPKDISTMNYENFRAAYFEIVKKSCDRLKKDRFACFVVGEVRNKAGNYVSFVSDTIKAFTDAGLEYYNEAILITAIGSLPIRAGRTFSASRKLGKTHQNILVFVKGDGKKAAAACGLIEIDESLFNDIDPISLDESDLSGVDT